MWLMTTSLGIYLKITNDYDDGNNYIHIKHFEKEPSDWYLDKMFSRAGLKLAKYQLY